jgi:hypothetical protein
MSKKKSEKPLEEMLQKNPESLAKTRLNTGPVSLKEYSKEAPFSFNSKNYRLLLIGLAINILGFVLMIGGGTDDPNKFDATELFSHTRITIAPMLIVAGYIVIMFAIMKKPKAKDK